MRRLLPILLLLALTACAQPAASGPTPGPGTPSATPAPTRTPKPTQGRPQGPTATPEPLPTARPTPAQPTPNAYIRIDMPAERVCTIRARSEWEEVYDYALLHLSSALGRARHEPALLAERWMVNRAKDALREIEALPEMPCTDYGKGVMLEAAQALVEAAEVYDERPDAALVILDNAQSAFVDAYIWFVGSVWWSTVSVPLH